LTDSLSASWPLPTGLFAILETAVGSFSDWDGNPVQKASMLQSHVVKRGSQFYFRIAVPLYLTKIEGKREIKASLRTSDAMSAKMRRRVLSDALELLFQVS
jgi:hypothetical protein